MTKFMTLVLAALLAVPTVAQARCRTSDLSGKWVVYTTVNNTGGFWQRCEFELNGTGYLAGAKNACRDVSNVKSNIIAGHFSASKNCRIRGEIGVAGVLNTFDHAWMVRDKQTFSGVGHSTASTFTFTAVHK